MKCDSIFLLRKFALDTNERPSKGRLVAGHSEGGSLLELFWADHAKCNRTSMLDYCSNNAAKPVRILAIILYLQTRPAIQKRTDHTSPTQSAHTTRIMSASVERKQLRDCAGCSDLNECFDSLCDAWTTQECFSPVLIQHCKCLRRVAS